MAEIIARASFQMPVAGLVVEPGMSDRPSVSTKPPALV
jgi:hypothetical protein